MKIAIRVDASARMGTGHLRRSLSLGLALRALGAEIRFVKRDLGIDSGALFAEHGFSTVVLPPPSASLTPDPNIPHSAWGEVSQHEDAIETAAALDNFETDWLVIDSYAFGADWHDAVRDALDCRIAQIEDLPDRRISPDLLIDHNYASDHRAKYARCLHRRATILGGPRYALLGPAYAKAEPYRFSEEVRSIGVFMGGVDAGNYSVSVLDALDTIEFKGSVEVVSTSANPHLATLRNRIAGRPDTTLSLDLPDLAAFFARHDIQVGAGGGATWERCRLAVPSLLVVVAPNQDSVAPRLADDGIVALAAEPTVEAMAAPLRELIDRPDHRRALSKRSGALVDGRGAERVALKMLADTLAVRPADDGDMELLFDWRNHPANRTVSRESGELEPSAHNLWFQRTICDPARKLFVGVVGDRPVGVIRFDFSAADRAEVSLYLDPELHGIGLGPKLLKAGEDASGAKTIDATVLSGNRASQLLFERAGYDRQSTETWVKSRG